MKKKLLFGGGGAALVILLLVRFAYAATYSVSVPAPRSVYVVPNESFFEFIDESVAPVVTGTSGVSVTSASNGVFVSWNKKQVGYSPERVVATWNHVGKFHGRWVRIEETFSNIYGILDPLFPGSAPVAGCTSIRIARSVRQGVSVGFLSEFDVEVKFFYEDTGEQCDMSGTWTTFGSLNDYPSPSGTAHARSEGVASLSSGTVQAQVTSDTSVVRQGNFFIGTSNDFQDDFGVSDGTSRLRASVALKGNEKSIRFRMKCSGTGWMWWLYAGLQPTSDHPRKTQSCGEWVYLEDTIDYTISQPIGYWGGSSFVKFQDIALKDTFSSYVTPQSVTVRKRYQNGTTSNCREGTDYTVSKNGSTWQVTFNRSYVNTLTYEGESLEAVFTVKVNNNVVNGTAINNKGWSILNDTSIETNEVTTKVKYYTITTSAVNGTITEKQEKIRSGDNRTINYTPNEGYYVAEITVDGVSLTRDEILANYSEYSFNDIQADHDIKVVCKPFPKVTVQKVYDLGYPVFGDSLFKVKIHGTCLFGHEHTYYRTLHGNETKSISVHPGYWYVEELPVSMYTQTNRVSVKNFIIEDSGDYCYLWNIDEGHIKFTNTFSKYKDYYHNNEEVNKLK